MPKSAGLSDFWGNYKSYHMRILGHKDDDVNQPPESALYFLSSKIAYNLFFSLGEYIREEAINITNLTDGPTDFDKISRLFFQEFKLEDFNDSGSLENKILQHIKKLKKNDFTLLLNFIGNKFRALRKEKIDFWEKILEKYMQNKDKYDKKVAYDHNKFKGDLNRATKNLIKSLREF